MSFVKSSSRSRSRSWGIYFIIHATVTWSSDMPVTNDVTVTCSLFHKRLRQGYLHTTEIQNSSTINTTESRSYVLIIWNYQKSIHADNIVRHATVTCSLFDKGLRDGWWVVYQTPKAMTRIWRETRRATCKDRYTIPWTFLVTALTFQ